MDSRHVRFGRRLGVARHTHRTADVDHDDVGAVRRELDRDGAADTPRSARDHRHFAGEQ
jgi:hypothetical protein